MTSDVVTQGTVTSLSIRACCHGDPDQLCYDTHSLSLALSLSHTECAVAFRWLPPPSSDTVSSTRCIWQRWQSAVRTILDPTLFKGNSPKYMVSKSPKQLMKNAGNPKILSETLTTQRVGEIFKQNCVPYLPQAPLYFLSFCLSFFPTMVHIQKSPWIESGRRCFPPGHYTL